MKSIYNLFATAGVIGLMAYLVLLFGLLAGWIMNIIALVHFFLGDTLLWSNLIIGRVIGLFLFPLGGVLGWF